MSKKARFLASIALIVFGLFGEPAFDFVKDNVDIKFWPDDTPVVVVDEPSLQYQDMVGGVVAIDIKKEDANFIAPFFAEVASVIKTDPGFLKSTGQFRDFNTIAGQLHFAGSDLKGKYPSLAKSIDASIIAAIGEKNEPLTDEKRENLISILEAVSWGVRQ